MIAQIYQPYGFNYTAVDQNDALFVQAAIYDITTGLPGTLFSTIDMVLTTPGSYDGSIVFEVGQRLYKIAMAVYTDGTYTILNTDYAPQSSMVQTIGNVLSGSQTVLGNQVIGHVTNIAFSTLPYVGDTLLDYFQPMTFEIVTKTVLGFQLVETKSVTSFSGVLQPFTSQQLLIKPEGQRAWIWYMLHCDPSLALNPDDVIIYQGVQFRVMQKRDYTGYGYIEYDVVNDYTGSGP